MPNNDEQQSNRALKIQQSKSTQCNIETADKKGQVQEGNIKFNESVYASIYGTIEQGNIDTGTQCDLHGGQIPRYFIQLLLLQLLNLYI